MSSESFARIVQVLQQLGASCVGQVLGGPAPAVSALLELQPAVATWFDSAAQVTGLRQQALQLLRHTRPDMERLDDPLSITMARTLDQRRPESGEALGLAALTPLPVQLWPVVAVLAWRQPDFRYATAARILGFLRANHLVRDGSQPCPDLDVRTFWVLLELAGMAQLKGLAAEKKPRDRAAAMLAREPRNVRAAGKLTRIVEAAVASRRWAGFWDQWAMLEAARRNRKRLEHAAKSVRCLLAALPWRDEIPSLRELERAQLQPEQPPEIAVEHWRQEVPVWLTANPTHWRTHVEA